VLVDAAAVALEDGIDGVEDAAHEGVQVLGIDGGAEARVAREVGEQDRHLPPLGLRYGSGEADLGRALSAAPVAERRDRPRELLPVAERDAELLEVILVEVRQGLEVDRVVAEEPLVIPEPQGVQPSRDIHARSPVRLWRSRSRLAVYTKSGGSASCRATT
jgi:hypothetical protein